jgi:hypothetical protein
VARFFEDDVDEIINEDDFGFSMSSGDTTFVAIFEYAYGEQFGFEGREVPTLTAKTSAVADVSAGDTVTVPAAAVPTSSVSIDFTVLVKQPDNTGVTVLVLEAQ